MMADSNDSGGGTTPPDAVWQQLIANANASGLPPAVVATPSDLALSNEPEPQWWQPTPRLRAVTPLMWIICIALGLIASGYVIWRWQLLSVGIFGIGKLLVFVIGGGGALVTWIGRRVTQKRTKPFCIFCGYSLEGLPDNYRCPECGRPYTWRLIAEYRRDPEWFIQRYRALRQMSQAQRGTAGFSAGPGPRRRSRDGT